MQHAAYTILISWSVNKNHYNSISIDYKFDNVMCSVFVDVGSFVDIMHKIGYSPIYYLVYLMKIRKLNQLNAFGIRNYSILNWNKKIEFKSYQFNCYDIPQIPITSVPEFRLW